MARNIINAEWRGLSIVSEDCTLYTVLPTAGIEPRPPAQHASPLLHCLSATLSTRELFLSREETKPFHLIGNLGWSFKTVSHFFLPHLNLKIFLFSQRDSAKWLVSSKFAFFVDLEIPSSSLFRNCRLHSSCCSENWEFIERERSASSKRDPNCQLYDPMRAETLLFRGYFIKQENCKKLAQHKSMKIWLQ